MGQLQTDSLIFFEGMARECENKAQLWRECAKRLEGSRTADSMTKQLEHQGAMVAYAVALIRRDMEEHATED